MKHYARLKAQNKFKQVMKCEKCGNKKAVRHHDDYSKPLEIRWLCKNCHNKHHGYERSENLTAGMGIMKKEKMDVLFALRISQELHQRMVQAARYQDRTVASMYRRIITRYVQRLKDGEKNGKRIQGE